MHPKKVPEYVLNVVMGAPRRTVFAEGYNDTSA